VGQTYDSHSLVFGKDTTKRLNNTGGNYGFLAIVPFVVNASNTGTPGFGNASFSMNIQPQDTLSSDNRVHYYSFRDTFYLQISTSNTYNFNVSLSTTYNNYGATVYTHSNGINTFIYDLLGNQISYYGLGQNGFDYTSASYSVYLCAGIYKILQTGAEYYSASDIGSNYTTNNYSWSCSNSTSPDYKNLNTLNGCVFTKGIGATDSLMNPTFTVPANKKMLFSAWVRENCGDPVNGIPCKDYTYTHNQVQLTFPGFSGSNIILSPDGPIIDGWQRYEGAFTAPSGATSMTVNLVNSGNSTIYFDDIRIHPYNANMNSYVYDPVNLRLTAELDPNNYTTFYEYDEEGTLTRTKVETKEGIKTVVETKSALQKVIQ
jgi:YD repeat-containing protein